MDQDGPDKEDPLAWINRLNAEETVTQLATLGLPTSGILPTLRQRLYAYLSTKESSPSQTRVENMSRDEASGETPPVSRGEEGTDETRIAQADTRQPWSAASRNDGAKRKTPRFLERSPPSDRCMEGPSLGGHRSRRPENTRLEEQIVTLIERLSEILPGGKIREVIPGDHPGEAPTREGRGKQNVHDEVLGGRHCAAVTFVPASDIGDPDQATTGEAGTAGTDMFVGPRCSPGRSPGGLGRRALGEFSPSPVVHDREGIAPPSAHAFGSLDPYLAYSSHAVPPPMHYGAQSYPRENLANQVSSICSMFSRLKISFTGRNGEDPEAFLLRLVDVRIPLNITDSMMLDYVRYALNGIALQWYRGLRSRWGNWPTFEQAFRSRFGGPNIQFNLRQEISKRTQGEGELVADYLVCMRSMLGRLTPPWPEREWIWMAYKNMVPRLQPAIDIDSIRTFEALENRACRVEEAVRATQTYCAPPPPDRTMYPELACPVSARGTRVPRRAAAMISELFEPNPEEDSSGGSLKDAPEAIQMAVEKSSPDNSGGERRPYICWNCRLSGHSWRDCPSTILVRRGSPLLYLAALVDEVPLPVLVDSGATRTFLGAIGWKLLRELNLPVLPGPPSTVTTADGYVVTIKGEVRLPMTIGFTTREVKARIFPSLSVPCILGLDALHAFGIVINFPKRIWWFESQPNHVFPFEREGREDSNWTSPGIQGSEGVPQIGMTIVERASSYQELGEDLIFPFPGGDSDVPVETGGESSPEEGDVPMDLCCGLSELIPREQAELEQFLAEERPRLLAAPGVTALTSHKIDVGSASAIKQRYYPVAPVVQKAIYEEVDRLLKEGIIEPSHSEWSSPIVMVRKSGGSYRFCLDYRRVNAVSKKDAYPLPYMQSILERLKAARYISAIDLSQAYFQIPMEESSREITAFTVPGRGLFHFRRMPFGLTGAPATFQRLLDKLIGPEMEPHAFAYLDDIIIVTETFPEHLVWLKRVFDRVVGAGLRINPDKSEFCKAEVKYLGFLVDKQGFRMDPDKTAPILEYPTPKNVKQVRRFMGMVSWYRKFIPNFATESEPINRLLRKNQAWLWGEDQEIAFRELRNHLVKAPTLACPNFNVPFVLQTDASTVGLGAVLTQEIEDTDRVIAYACRTLTSAERNYTTTEQECLAVIWAIRKFRAYLEGTRFTVITDHSSLLWLHNVKNPTGRLARWGLELLEYDYKILHRKGALHHVPDALSRMFEGNGGEESDTTPQDSGKIYSLGNEEEDRRDESDDWVDLDDDWYTNKYEAVNWEPKKYRDWRISHGRLYINRPSRDCEPELSDLDAWKLVVPRKWQIRILEECHGVTQAGHLGIEKTYHRACLRYYWPKMYRDAHHYVSRCDTCQKTKVETTASAGLMGRRVVERPWEYVAADIMGPFPPSKQGYAYVLVIQDYFTKWVELCALRRATGPKIRDAFHEMIVSRWGTPKVLLTDNGTEFVNRVIDVLCRDFGIYHSTTPPYHPQANPVERVNRVIKTMIVAFLKENHREWDNHLADFRFAFNTARHSTLGLGPAFLNFGRELSPIECIRNKVASLPRLGEVSPSINGPPVGEDGSSIGEITFSPIGGEAAWSDRMKKLQAVREWVTQRLDQAFVRQSKPYNSKRRDEQFRVGDLVLSRAHVLSSAMKNFAAKLTPKFTGPSRVIKVISPLVYEVEDLTTGKKSKSHLSHLKSYIPAEESPDTEPRAD
ncbi:uncharacterized protein [Prorops nasuta]|uniref:uncharacterized protein n=1 Tax=Prorops nasuta TaxID=863751 RepID=UPI0034CE53A9